MELAGDDESALPSAVRVATMRSLVFGGGSASIARSYDNVGRAMRMRVILLTSIVACQATDMAEDPVTTYGSGKPTTSADGGEDFGEAGPITTDPVGPRPDLEAKPWPPPVEPCEELDPSRAYLIGTFNPGYTHYDTVADPTSPTQTCSGFADRPRRLRIRPTDGRIFYADSEGIFEYRPEPLVWAEGMMGSYWDYPADPRTNDVAVPFMCSGLFYDFRFHPATGEMLMSCFGADWVNERGESIYEGSLLAVGHGSLLAGKIDDPDPRIVIDGMESALIGPPGTEQWVAGPARVLDSGYWLVMRASDGTAGVQRWRIDGTQVLESEPYVDLERGAVSLLYSDTVLAGDGSLVGIDWSGVQRVYRCLPRACEEIYGDPETTHFRELGYEDWPTIGVWGGALFSSG